MSFREERLPTRGTFCSHCGKPAQMCACAARDMRNLDDWDSKQLDPKTLKKAQPEPADARTVKPGHPVGYHEVAPASKKPAMDFKVEVIEPAESTDNYSDDDDELYKAGDGSQIVGLDQWVPRTERDIDKALSGIHALANHLLGIVPGYETRVRIEIAPTKPGEFMAAVTYNGFAMVKHGATLADVLHELLADLTDRVAKHAIAADELLEQVQSR